MRARVVKPARGLAWLAEGWWMFRAAPLGWLVIVFIYMMGWMLLWGVVPLIGPLAWHVLMPALLVGFMTASRAAWRRQPVDVTMLVAGFGERVPSLLVLGALYSAGFVAAVSGSALFDGGEFAQSLLRPGRGGGDAPEGFPAGVLGFLSLYLPVEMLLWFSPVLVAWHGVAPAKAVFYSGAAAWLNLRAFVVYAIALAALIFAVFGILALFTSLLPVRPAAAAAQPLLVPAELVLLPLLPMMFASRYASYRDVFGAENG